MTSEDLEHLNKYTDTTGEPDRIMVVGVGGGGGNAVNHMYNEAVIHGVSFVVVNTDDMALKCSPVPRKLLIGPTVTRGRGAGNVPERAREAAEESAEDIRALFTDETDMVFITAGMGGGTGTGAAPVVARIARERGLLTIGIVTIPFLCEGLKKIAKAVAGAEEMGKYVDALLVINNERLSEIYPDLAFEESFAKADDTLSIAAQSISEIVTNPGYINLDFNDVDTTLRNGGTAIISIGYGEGDNRVSAAIEDALHSPLLKNTDVFSSKKLLFNLSYSRKAEHKFRTDESRELDDFVTKIDSGVDVIWGITYDDTLGEKVKLTILAAGFDVTVRENDERVGDIIIEGRKNDDDTAINNDVIKEYYGKEKIDDLQRHNDTRHYILLEADQLDNDEILDTFERTPAYNRNKKPAKVKAASDDRRQQRQTDRPSQTKNNRDTDNIIDFSLEE